MQTIRCRHYKLAERLSLNFWFQFFFSITIGYRLPGIFFFSNSYKLHITSQIGHNGNYAYNDLVLEENKWQNLKINQKKVSLFIWSLSTLSGRNPTGMKNLLW